MTQEAIATLHQDLQDLVGNTIAERYRIDGLLGLGGMAAVFRAHHLGLKRDVAVKVLHPDLTRSPEICARFDREAHSASRLDHPNVVQVTDYGSTDAGMKFMVMHLLEGGELTQLLGNPISAKRSVELILQILRGLEHAHKQGVVHRDIKPENIFITRDHDDRENLKLVDFGISKIVGGESEDHKTTVGLVFGTPAYMSPEQAAGLEADERADLYSVGIILYQLLSGRLPIDHEDPVSLVRMQVSVDPEPLPSNVPPVLAAIVQRLLAKSRDDRFQTATEVIETLEAVLPLFDPNQREAGVPHPVLSGHTSTNSWASAPLGYGSGRIGTGAIKGNSGPITVGSGPVTGSTGLFGNSGALPLGSGAIGLDDGRRYDWRIAAVGGMLVTLLVGWFVWPESKAGLMEDSANADDEYAGDEQPRVGPGAATLAEIDRLLLADRLDEADKLLGPLRDTFPKDPELLWRHGRLLDKSKRKESQALAAYGKAIEADASLLEDKEFYAELHEVMRHPKVRDEALDLALHQMGAHGHKFLLELVNAERKPLSYEHRQRALEELVKAPENEARINRKLNVALDLLQASQSLTPCESYRRALERIAANPDYYYFPRVERAPMPTPAADKANEGDAAHCEGLAERKETVLTMLAILEPSGGDTDSDGESDGLEDVVVIEDETPTTAASKKKPAAPKKNNVKTVRGSSDCKKFGAGIFNKKCRK